MNELKVKRTKNLLRVILFFLLFLVELYLYVFVRNENILDLIVTIAVGIIFIVALMIYFKDSKEKNFGKTN